MQAVNNISDKTWDQVLDICLAAKTKYPEKISCATKTLTLKFDQFISHVTIDPIEIKSWYEFIISQRSKKQSLCRSAISMSYIRRAQEISFDCNLLETLTAGNDSKRRKEDESKNEEPKRKYSKVDVTGKGFADDKKYLKEIATDIFKSILQLTEGNQSRKRSGAKRVEILIEVMALIENYVGDTVPARDRNESLTAVLNIKNFIGNLMKHGKRDKIQLHTLSIIGTACYGGIVSKRSLMLFRCCC